MSILKIEGGHPLSGTVRISGNKNAILPMIAATLLTDQEVILNNVPNILDVRIMLDVARSLGAKVEHEAGLDLVRHLGAQRFAPWSLADLGKILAMKGQRREATKLVEEAFQISQQTGVTFVGPRILGALALVSDEPLTRQWALQEGEKMA